MTTTFVVDRWDAARGGQEGYLFALARELARRGEAVRVLCRAGADAREGIAVEPLVPPGGGAAGERAFLSAAARRAGQADGPVLAPRLLPFATHVQLHGGLFADALAAERESLEGLRRTLFPLGNALNARRRLLLRLERGVLASGGRRVMVWTGALRGRLLARGVPPPSIRVSRPGVDLALFGPAAGPAGGPPELLFLAHNPRLKGLGAALAALALARRRGLPARLRVVGRGSARPWRRLAARLGVGEAVVFEGALPPGEVAARLAGATALVHPTFLDPCSLACLEAAACGVPVITTRRNGAAETLEGAGAALLVEDPRDADALARAMAEAAEPSRRAALREGAIALRPALDARRHLDEVLSWLAGG